MRFVFTSILVFLFSLSGTSENEIREKERVKIMALLDKQVEAWNQGNIEKFMETYWNSDKLVFVGSRGPTYGWQATFNNYKKSYPDKITMGKLEFTVLKITKIDKKTVFVIGKFDLTREIGNLSGHYTLVIQKMKKEWLIRSDHSSSSN